MRIRSFALIWILCTGGLLAQNAREKAIAELSLESTPTGEAWERIHPKDHHGIAFPLLGIHSQNSSGNGEFLDLCPMIDWLQSMHMDILQLLPLNDTGEAVGFYGPISFYALNPIYLSLASLPYLNEASLDLIKDLNRFKTYNKTKRVEYKEVLHEKQKWLRKYVDLFEKKLVDRPYYQYFLTDSLYWLTDYALYKVLQTKYGADWEKWPQDMQHISPQSLKKLKQRYAKEMLFYQIVQSLCFEQMEKVHHYANQHQVYLVGDLTFLIAKNSCEVWRHPDFFKLNISVGSPPDKFFPKGQYWNLPAYNWEVIDQTQDNFLAQRVQTFSRLYDIYRLDNAIGYFSQYEIPEGSLPKEGRNVPLQPSQVIPLGKKRLLHLIHAAPMLPIAESIRMDKRMMQVLRELGIPGLITVVGLNGRSDVNHQVIDGKDFSLLAVSMLSNQDIEPLSLWWELHPQKAQAIALKRGWKYQKSLSTSQKQQWVQMNQNSNSIFHIEMLQDILPQNLTWPPHEERINIPGTNSSQNWTYRYKLSVEEMTSNPKIPFMILPSVGREAEKVSPSR